jgi:hypothetical protein
VAVAPEDRAAVVGDAMRRAWDASGVRTESFSVKRPATRYELL